MKLGHPEIEYSMKSPGLGYKFVANIYGGGEIITRLWRFMPKETIAMCVLCGKPYLWRRTTDRCECDV